MTSAYERICKANCQYCADIENWPLGGVKMRTHYPMGYPFLSPLTDSKACTAPTLEQVVEELAAEVAESERALRHGESEFLRVALAIAGVGFDGTPDDMIAAVERMKIDTERLDWLLAFLLDYGTDGLRRRFGLFDERQPLAREDIDAARKESR